MPARPCPRCQKLLEIPQPVPPKIQCPHCAAVIRLAAPATHPSAAVGDPVVAGAPAAPASQLDLTLSRHDLAGQPLPAQAANPFVLGEESDTSLVEAPRRRSGGNGLLYGLLGLLLIGCGVLAFFLLNRQPQETTPEFNLDKGPVYDNLQARIHEASIRGVSYLRKQVMEAPRLYYRSELADVSPANAHLGATALAGLTLLECGAEPDDPAVQQAAKAIRDGADQIFATYTLATAILFLDRLHLGKTATVGERQGQADFLKDTGLIRTFALRLMTCQDKGGLWGYGRKTTEEEEEQTFQSMKAGKFVGDQLWYKNLSNSQFAALALWAARKHGVPVRPALQAVARAAREQQKENGTWHYDHNLAMTHSSVCAGLIFLALERGLEEEGPRSGAAGTTKLTSKVLDDPAIKKGLSFLGNVVRNPPKLSQQKRDERILTAARVTEYYQKYEQSDKQMLPDVSWTMHFAFSGTIMGADSWGDLYLLWSIERVAVIYDLKKIGDKDWYAWGADIILNNQQPDGGWKDRFPGVPDTCFALLFLKRANLVKDLTDKLREVAMQAVPAQNPQAPMPPKKG